MHHNSILNQIQLDATVCSMIYFTAESLYMFRVSQHPSSGVLKTVTTASGTGHNIGTAASFQRGQIWPRWKEVAVLFSTHDGCGGHPKHVERFCTKINQTSYCCILLDFYLYWCMCSCNSMCLTCSCLTVADQYLLPLS